jgi:hypothetical protein
MQVSRDVTAGIKDRSVNRLLVAIRFPKTFSKDSAVTKVSNPYFLISGQFDPDDITRDLGIEPSWVERIGDPGPSDALGPRLGAVWVWQPQDDDSDDMGDQLAYLAGALSLKRERVAALSKDFGGTLHVAHLEDRRSSWFLSADTLRLIADLHVNIEYEQVGPKESC